MGDLGFGQIILLIVFILVPVIKFVMQRVRRRLEDQIPEEESVTQIRRQAQATPALPPEPRISHDRLHGFQAPTVSTPLPRRGSVKKLTLGSRREIRRGIILMTVLGPCRTFDPDTRN